VNLLQREKSVSVWKDGGSGQEAVRAYSEPLLYALLVAEGRIELPTLGL
jgi:hypothetical protein